MALQILWKWLSCTHFVDIMQIPIPINIVYVANIIGVIAVPITPQTV